MTHSKASAAKIINGPIHPLTPPSSPSIDDELDPKKLIHPSIDSPSNPSTRSSSSPPLTSDPILTQDSVATLQLNRSQNTLTIHSNRLGINNLELSYLWLRDSCQAHHSIDPRTKQKLFKSSDIPIDIHPIQSKFIIHPHHSQPQLYIEWSHPLTPDRVHESSSFDLSFLSGLKSPNRWEADRHRTQFLRPKLWSASSSSKSQGQAPDVDPSNQIEELRRAGRLFIDYRDLKHDLGLQKLTLERLNSLGLVFFHHLHPQHQHSNVNGPEEHQFELGRLIETLGIDIRRTFYGDLWDVISLGNQAKNVANTNLALDFHMDLCHFENPPRFQFLHCLKNQVIGGSSKFLDSYSVLDRLLIGSPDSFKTLAEEPIGFEYINDRHHTFFKHPTIQLKPKLSIDRILNDPDRLLDSLVAVNYSPPFQAPFPHPPTPSNERLTKLFRALKSFEALFDLPSQPPASDHSPFKFEIQLEAGQAVAFDNRRILHARTAFESKPAPEHQASDHQDASDGQVQRWLKGAYVDGDSVWDRIRVLNSN